MPDDQGLDVRQFQWLLQQRIVVEINLADREIIGGAPIGVKQAQFLRVQSGVAFRRPGGVLILGEILG